MHHTDRRRLTLALVVTLVAVPAFFLSGLGDDGSADEPPPTAVATESAGADDGDGGNVINPVPAPAGDASSDTAATTVGGRESRLPPIEGPDDQPAFMEGPVGDPGDDSNEIATPARPAVAPIRLTGTYRSTVAGARSCQVPGLSGGLTVTVTNLDNGRSISCVTTVGPADGADEVVMHTRSFEKLADLTEAPIAVEVQP